MRNEFPTYILGITKKGFFDTFLTQWRNGHSDEKIALLSQNLARKKSF